LHESGHVALGILKVGDGAHCQNVKLRGYDFASIAFDRSYCRIQIFHVDGAFKTDYLAACHEFAAFLKQTSDGANLFFSGLN
jgi:hypothetical protein